MIWLDEHKGILRWPRTILINAVCFVIVNHFYGWPVAVGLVGGSLLLIVLITFGLYRLRIWRDDRVLREMRRNLLGPDR